MLPALRRAKSLLAFHISGNPGITPRLIEYYQTKLRVAEQDRNLNLHVQKEQNLYKAALKDPDTKKVLTDT